MEKLNLHETLRIYMPGLLLCLSLFFIETLSLKDIQWVLLPALFASLLLHAITQNLHKKLFDKIRSSNFYFLSAGPVDFNEAFQEIVSAKFELLGKKELRFLLHREHMDAFIEFMDYSYFAKRYESREINCFRSPKSFGIMCYNMAVVCLVLLVVLVFKIGHQARMGGWHAPHLYDYLELLLVFLASCALFLTQSEKYFRQSLTQELNYWKSINQEETEELIGFIRLWKKLEHAPSTATRP